MPIVYYEVWKYGNVLLFNHMNMYKNYSLCLEYLDSHGFNNYNSIHIINVTTFYYGKYIESIEVSMIFDEFNKPCKILPGMTINHDVNYDNKGNNQYLVTLSFLIDHNGDVNPIVDDGFQTYELLSALDKCCSLNHLQSV